ncbi:MAG TPA: pyridoxal-dependent decarboxylase, partial [Acidimicrobiales bacterium]|nr:pyridoxal-dependent decarboxylase [Acidimicrobiales bacterium]
MSTSRGCWCGERWRKRTAVDADGSLLRDVAAYATDFLSRIDERSVAPKITHDEVRRALDRPLTDDGVDAETVVTELIDDAEDAVVGIAGSRYFGFVIGGSLPAALAADWITSTWDQNAGLFACGGPATVAEDVAGRWLVDLLGLPRDASVAFTTGAMMASFTGVLAARHHVLAAAGWDVARHGLAGSPPIRVVVGRDRHATIDRALRFAGIGTDAIVAIDTGDAGAIRVDALGAALSEAPGAPTIVCAQAGEVNTGAFDPLGAVCDVAHEAGAWVHVDGAFGLWAAASPSRRHLVAGAERADSWVTDGHKWLNVPYDCGLAFCAHPASHRAALGVQAAYLVHSSDDGPRDPVDWTPEFSRRGRGIAVYAAL